MREFVGRERELATLREELAEIGARIGTAKPGRCILMRGRRRVGKSTLIEEFIRLADVPSLFFTAAGRSEEQELQELVRSVAESSLPDRASFLEDPPGDWAAAFRSLNEVLPDDRPSVLVVDEVPYLAESADAFEGVLQRAWDRLLCRKPVLLLLIGSDLSMMEALNRYDRPFHQRGQEMVLHPLTPADLQDMLGLDAATAFDARLITGGMPLICAQWPRSGSVWRFLRRSLDDPISPLLVSAERSLAAEFPPRASAKEVMRALGSGECTFTKIVQRSGLSPAGLTKALEPLTEKGIVSGDLPLSLRPSRERRYRITDSYLRFWLTFLRPNMALIERSRGDLALERIRERWTAWRGRAIEPLLRASLARILPAAGVPAALEIGAYWDRTNTVEIDIVGGDRAPVAKELSFLGSIKWLEHAAFSRRDFTALAGHAQSLTREPLPLVAVTRSGVADDVEGLRTAFGPDDLIQAWRPA